MTTTDTGQLRRELLLEQAIEQKANQLVRLASAAVLKLDERSEMKTSQLRNAVNVAHEEGSFDVIANFIRYKIATQGKAWGTGRESFGHTIIAHLNGPVRAEAEGALAWLEDKHNATQLPEYATLGEDLYRAMMRRYFGYAVRAFAYYEKAGDKAEARKILEGAAHGN